MGSVFLELGKCCNMQHPGQGTPTLVKARVLHSEGLSQDLTGNRDVKRIPGFQSRRNREDSNYARPRHESQTHGAVLDVPPSCSPAILGTFGISCPTHSPPAPSPPCISNQSNCHRSQSWMCPSCLQALMSARRPPN